MPQLQVSQQIKESPLKVWNLLKDFGGIYRFNSGVERSPITNGIESGLGAERTCHLYDGSDIDEVVSGYREGEWMEVTITRAAVPLKDPIAQFTVIETPDGFAEVVAQVDYTPKFGVLGSLLNALVIRRKFTQVFQDLLAGLALHAETGVEIGKDGVEAAEQRVRGAA